MLTVKDSDSGDTSTRTYSYQGVDLYSAQISLPVSFEQEADIPSSSFYQIRGWDYVLPGMGVILALNSIVEIVLIMVAIKENRKKKSARR